MSDHDERSARDPRDRPPDPAGTRPRHDPAALLPTAPAPQPHEPDVVDADAVEEDGTAAGTAGDRPDLLPERPAPAAPPAQRAAEEHSPYAPRFQFVLGALLAVGAAAVVAVAALIVAPGGGSGPKGPAWSAWAPSAKAGDGAQQIAAHVGPAYRLPDHHQIVLISAGGLEVAGLPLTVALRESTKQGGNIVLYDGKGVLYRMCGLGQNCAIATGKPSTARGFLLRREALELALYSFRYLDGVKQVVVFLPPPKGKRPSSALFFRADDNRPELQRPLRATLAPRVPSVGTVTASPDAALVDQLTEPTQFRFSLTPANQDNSAFLVLDPFDPSAPLPSGGQQVSGSGSGG
jgi:hypothetical protein